VIACRVAAAFGLDDLYDKLLVHASRRADAFGRSETANGSPPNWYPLYLWLRTPMIKDVMVWLDGSLSDEVRLTAGAEIARRFESQVIGLFLNLLPLPGPVDGGGGALATAELIERAREAGDRIEAILAKRLELLQRPIEIRRFDVLADDIANVAAREARSADTFVALKPNGSMDPERLVEGVLFGSGRHIYLIPEPERREIAFDRVLVA
jgi:hypothetical protein